MDRSTQDRLAARIRALRRDRTTDLAPATYRVPAADYTSRDVLAAELATLFRGGPLLAGLGGEAPAAGDWFSFDACGRSVVVWRRPDGTLAAFVNACRHRGMRIATGCGRGERLLACPYHGWSYDADGRLATLPGAEGFSDVDRDGIRLAPVPVHEAAGLVWVGGAAPDLGGVEAELAPFGLGTWHRVDRRERRLALNWKLAVDSFLEAYHLHSLHQETLRPTFHGNVAPFDAFGPNCRIAGVRRSFDGLRDGESLLPHVTILWLLFPNAVLIHQQDHVELYQAFPDLEDPSLCDVRLTLYAPRAPERDAELAHWRRNLDLIDHVTTTEDFAACAAIQANLRAGATPFLLLGRNEPGVAHFHRALHAVLGAPEETPPCT